jgi:plastocyanin
MLGTVVLTAGVMIACSEDEDGTGPVGPEVIEMRDNSFSPQNVTVDVGTAVRWVNEGNNPHNTTSGSAWSSSNLQPDQSFERTFTTAGTFPYVCTLHAGMAGTVTVE